MVFVGFMEGSKAVRYWDKEGRSIKVSRNFAFSENEELKELQITELPGLEAEGENSQSSALQTQETITKNSTQENPIPRTPNQLMIKQGFYILELPKLTIDK